MRISYACAGRGARHLCPAHDHSSGGKEWPRFLAVIQSIWGECRPDSISPDFAMREQSDFRDYQRWMSDQIREKAAVLLAVPMSMVKNPAVLIAARELLDEFVRPAKRAILISRS